MRITSLATLGLLGMMVAVSAASAQSNVTLDAPGLMPAKKAPPPPPPRAQPLAWPRLDPGAVICRTQYDLDQHAANLVARTSGGTTTGVNCRIVAQPTAIQIVQRMGPGRTHIKVTGSPEEGWTDVWLPERAPGR